MVALNTDFAASKPDTDTKNRVGRFFSLAAETVGADRCSTQSNTREKQDCDYDLASSHCYGPFGELIRSTGLKSEMFDFRFSTKYEDTETGLLYYGYRYYNAETGRWLNRDPIGELGGLNIYGFIGNNAVNLWDILGLKVNDNIFEKDRWKFNSNSITIVYCGCDPEAVSRAVTNAFSGFTNFDYPKVYVDASNLKKDGVGIVRFNPRGADGVINDLLGWMGGLYFTHDVTTYGPLEGSSVDQRAITNEGHGLVGIRVWGHNNVSVPDPYASDLDNEYYAIQGWTMAQETYNNLGGLLGGESRINSTAAEMWPDYLRDTLMGVLRDLDCREISVSVEASSYGNPASAESSNPFFRYIPEEQKR